MRLPSKIGNYKLPPFVLLMMEHAQLTERIDDSLFLVKRERDDGFHAASAACLDTAMRLGKEAQKVWKEARKESRHER